MSGNNAVQGTAQTYLDAVHTACTGAALDRPLTALHDAAQATSGQPVTRADVVELLAHHALTLPLYEALLADPCPAVRHDPVNRALTAVLTALSPVVDVDLAPLTGLYRRAADRAAATADHAARQPLISGLYEHFFRTALPRLTDRHGIVYTPVEVVDFMLRSTDQALRRSHGCGLADERVQVLDPFVGTGLYFVRLLQSDLIPDADLTRVYREQLHGHEIVPLAWHIARTNVAVAYAERTGRWLPYTGLALADTFADTCPRCGNQQAAAA